MNNTNNSQLQNIRDIISQKRAQSRRKGRRGAALIFAGLSFVSARASADTLTVYAYPSPTGINWASPNTLAWSTIGSMLHSDDSLVSVHAIGHMNFDLSCDRSSQVPGGARIVAGQTSVSSSEEMSQIFKQGYGLQVFLTPAPGRWESQADIEADIPLREQRGSVAFIEFAIPAKTCARVVKYLKEYKARGLDQIYGGLQDRPRHQEGGGCSAFTESVMEVAGVMDPVWSSYFRHHVNVPNSLLGGPSGRRVPFTDLLFNFKSFRWSATTRDAYALDFWDPYFVYYWITQASQRPLLLQKFRYTPARHVNALGVAIDARSFSTPTESFWQ